MQQLKEQITIKYSIIEDIYNEIDAHFERGKTEYPNDKFFKKMKKKRPGDVYEDENYKFEIVMASVENEVNVSGGVIVGVDENDKNKDWDAGYTQILQSQSVLEEIDSSIENALKKLDEPKGNEKGSTGNSMNLRFDGPSFDLNLTQTLNAETVDIASVSNFDDTVPHEIEKVEVVTKLDGMMVETKRDESKPLSIINPSDDLRIGKRAIKPSYLVRSPYVSKKVCISTSVTSFERKVADCIFSGRLDEK